MLHIVSLTNHQRQCLFIEIDRALATNVRPCVLRDGGFDEFNQVFADDIRLRVFSPGSLNNQIGNWIRERDIPSMLEWSRAQDT